MGENQSLYSKQRLEYEAAKAKSSNLYLLNANGSRIPNIDLASSSEKILNVLNYNTGKVLEHIETLKDHAESINNANDLISKANASLSQIVNINVKSYGALGDGITDDTAAIQNAIDIAYQSVVNYGIMQKACVMFPTGTYKITNTINISPYVHLVMLGRVIFSDYSTLSKPAISINGKTSDIDYDYSFFSIPTIFDFQGTFRLINNSGVKTGRTGILVTGVNSETNCMKLKGVNIVNYAIGLDLDCYNMYLNDFDNLIMSGNTVAMQIGNHTGTNVNSGERISLRNSLFSQNECCIKFIDATPSIPLNIYNTSFDYNWSVIHIYGQANFPSIKFDGCHIEGIGWRSGGIGTGSYDGFSGIVKSESTHTNWFDNTLIDLVNTKIVHCIGTFPGLLFSGLTLVVTIDNATFIYNEDLMRDASINNMTNAFIVDNNVKKINIKNWRPNSTSPHLSSNLSVIDPYFTKDTITTFPLTGGVINLPASTVDYDIVSSQHLSKCEIVTVDGINCIGGIPPYAGSTSDLYLRSKVKYPIIGNNFDAMIFTKGYKTATSSLGSINLEFYNSNDILLDTIEVTNTFRIDETGVSNSVWIFPYKNKANSINIPKSTMYYKIYVHLVFNLGSSDTGEVYFSGIHVFNY